MLCIITVAKIKRKTRANYAEDFVLPLSFRCSPLVFAQPYVVVRLLIVDASCSSRFDHGQNYVVPRRYCMIWSVVSTSVRLTIGRLIDCRSIQLLSPIVAWQYCRGPDSTT